MTIEEPIFQSPAESSVNESLEKIMSEIHDVKLDVQEQLKARGGSARVCDLQEPEFDPKLHICAGTPSQKYVFEDLGIEKPACAASEIAATAPFPLYTPESIPLVRKAILNPAYINETGVMFGRRTLIVRNVAAYSPFFRRLCSDPAVMRALSEAAGVELEPVMETMELGHANIQVDLSKYHGIKDKDKLRAIATDLTSGKYSQPGQVRHEVQKRSNEEIGKKVDQALIPWHYDSYPWVCVAMISDTTDMVGGETVIRRGDGVIQGISQPGMGSAMMLQGGLVKHLALPTSSSAGDRITIITSFRPKAVGLYDSSFMTNIRCYSDLPLLYLQWIQYRLDRLDPAMKKLQDKKDFCIVKDAQDEQDELALVVTLKEYAKRTLRQMVPFETVQALNDRLGMHIFYSVRDDYVSGALFSDPKKCPRCTTPGAKVDKVHLAVCPGSATWQPNNPVWWDCYETQQALKVKGVYLNKRLEELQVREIINNWSKESRNWGIADELAIQGLNEYLIEFLEYFGIQF
ncbi:hypothetical protein EDC01DRAFT_631418 [Geopyxis carbonaria]|nr:hypothetical protein EDC01DRAFT_631418 [Geopyxis carbonaria]